MTIEQVIKGTEYYRDCQAIEQHVKKLNLTLGIVEKEKADKGDDYRLLDHYLTIRMRTSTDNSCNFTGQGYENVYLPSNMARPLILGFIEVLNQEKARLEKAIAHL